MLILKTQLAEAGRSRTDSCPRREVAQCAKSHSRKDRPAGTHRTGSTLSILVSHRSLTTARFGAAALLCLGLLVQTRSAWASEPEITEYAHGFSRVTRDHRIAGRIQADGTGIDSTFRWADGSQPETLRFTVFEPGPALPIVEEAAPFYATVAIHARTDGSELVSIEGWGKIEIWPAENDVRAAWATAAGQGGEGPAWVWITSTQQCAFDVWIQRDGDPCPGCGGHR